MIRAEMEANEIPFGEAVRDVAKMTVFTTHTPVAAGHDRFPAALVEENLGKLRESLHLSYDDFMGLGRVYPSDLNEPYCMTVLALKLSRHANGVERSAWPGLATDVAPALSQPARGERADRPHHERGPRADLDRSPDAAPLRPAPRSRLAQGSPQSGDLGEHRSCR